MGSKIKFIVTALFTLSISGSYAADFVVENGQTVTTTQVLTDDGDQGLIEAGGVINVNATGVLMQNNNQQVQNFGLISTTGNGYVGIRNENGFNALIINEGQITTNGLVSHGIFNFNADNATIVNRGSIFASGVGAEGIFINQSDNPTVVNSGTIISEQAEAILFESSSNPTLVLQQGSNLQGRVGSISHNLNLNVEKGLNLLLTLSDASNEFGNLNIDSPYVLLNNKQIAVVDDTLFHMQEDMAADISDNILGGVFHDCCPNPCDCGVWTQTVGSYRHRSEDDDFLEYKDWHVGQIVGYNTEYCGASIGIFGGYLYGEGETDYDLDKLHHNTFFAGLSFTQKICDACVGLTFAAGYVDWNQKLTVMDNLAEGGVDHYRFDTNAALFTSEFMINKQFCCECWNPKLTFYLRHVGLYLGKDKAEGVNGTIGIEDRNIDLLTTRLDVALPKSLCGYCLEPFVGVYGRYQLRGDKLELKGSNTEFEVGFTDSLVAGVVGLRGYHNVCGKELAFSVSGDFDNKSSSRVMGSLGLKF